MTNQPKDRDEEIKELTNDLINRQWSRTNANDLAEYLIYIGYRKHPDSDHIVDANKTIDQSVTKEYLAFEVIAKVMEGRGLFGGQRKEECALDIVDAIQPYLKLDAQPCNHTNPLTTTAGTFCKHCKQLVQDSCDDDTDIRQIAELFLPHKDVYGDGSGVPPITEVVWCLARRIFKLPPRKIPRDSFEHGYNQCIADIMKLNQHLNEGTN